jgi:transcriptional antiterminator
MNKVIQNHMHPDEAAYIAAYIVQQILMKNLTIRDVDANMIIEAVTAAEAYTELMEE